MVSAGVYLRKAIIPSCAGKYWSSPAGSSSAFSSCFFGPAPGQPGSLYDPYRHSDQHLCHPGRQLGPPVRFHRADKFRPRPVFWGGGLRVGAFECSRPYSSLGKRASGGRCCGLGRSYCRNSLSQTETHLSGPDHPGLSDHSVGDHLRHARFDRR